MLLLIKKEFIAGILMAVILVAALMNVSSLHALASKPIPEIEFSQKLGLFDSSRLTNEVLSSNISELAFQRALNVVLVKSGIIRKFNMTELVELGIIRDGGSNGSISRQGAAKSIMRAIVHGWYREVLKRDGLKNINPFKDWEIESRYSEPLAYAVQHNIFRGSTSGKFNPYAKLKVKEALAFLMRFYDNAVGVGNEPTGSFEFKPTDTGIELLCKENEQEFAAQFERLKTAGAFDLTNLGGKVRGDSAITTQDITALFLGIMQKLNKPAFISQIKYYGQTSTQTYANRDILACMATNLVEAIPHKTFEENKVVYSDVSPLCEVDYALNNLARAGIRMGYTDSMFKGYERVSIYEVFGLIDRVLTDLQPRTPSLEKQTMNSEEIEAWKKRLVRRKNRIRKILDN